MCRSTRERNRKNSGGVRAVALKLDLNKKSTFENGDCADAGTDESRRPGEDRSEGCGTAGAQLSVRRSYPGVGSERRFGGIARSGAGARGGQAGSVAGASSAEQVSAAHGAVPGGGKESVDAGPSELGQASALHASSAGIYIA